MSRAPACPEVSILEDFAAGRLAQSEAAELREHLAICSACNERVEVGDKTAAGILAATLPASPQVDLEPLSQGEHVGRFVVVRELGRGGMGVVYLAYDPELDRRVALKVLHAEALEGRAGGESRSRLTREAHAMAKLTHANVVAIYDVGTLGVQVFLAMELVDGTTVKEWLQENPRSWREVLRVFVEAGRGLSAAHTAGLVHRDFKPANVLIGKDGTVKVTDFGLARALSVDAPGASGPHAAIEVPPDRPSGDLLATPLTLAGSILGTPAFMSPEQLLGTFVDARSDQFSFCVSLYQGLYGERPFGKRAPPAVLGPIRPAPACSKVPAWVRRLVLRGLAIEPAERYPTLDVLLDALADDPAVRRRRQLGIAAGAVFVIAVLASTASLAQRHRAADVCYEPQKRLAGIWDAKAQERMRSSLLASEEPGAPFAATYTASAVDGAVASWIAAYGDACRATREQRSQTESALLLRIDCLDRQALALRAATDFLDHTGKLDVSSAVGIASFLPLSSECSDARSLSLIEPPPLELRSRVAALRVRLAAGAALSEAGKVADGYRVLDPLATEAGLLGYAPLHAEALHTLARSTAQLGRSLEYDQAALALSESSHMDQLSANIAARLVKVSSLLHRPAAEVDALVVRAKALLERVGNRGLAEYVLEDALCISEQRAGRDASAVAHGKRAVALAKSLVGDEHPLTLIARNNLGGAFEGIGAYDGMLSNFREGLIVAEHLLGPKSDQSQIYQLNIAETLANLGRMREAKEAADRMLASAPAGAESVLAPTALAIKALAESTTGAVEEALRLASLASDGAQAVGLSDEPDTRRYLAEVYLRTGRPGLATQEFERIVAVVTLDPASPDWLQFLRVGGAAYLAAGQPGRALELLERALPLTLAHPFYPGWVADIRFHLAQALVATHGDERRAAELVQQARDELAKLPEQQRLLADVNAWRSLTAGGGQIR